MTRLFETQDEPQGGLIQRAVWWAMFVSHVIATQADIREKVPDGASVIALPTDDPELFAYNLDLAEQQTDVPQIFLRVKRQEAQVNVYVPMQVSNHGYCLT